MLAAWEEFVKGKRKKRDVQEFGRYLMANILALHEELRAGTYRHGDYTHFKINDPKPRDIHKASVRDRLLHHAIYCVLYPFFDRTFISDSYSCRVGKGTHKAIDRFREFGYQVSNNNTRTCWVLKCDIRKFFASIDHALLRGFVNPYIHDERIQQLVRNIVSSFHTEGKLEKGLPLGNLTSQLLVNIYMNEFDQFVKHTLKAKQYIRYADDFVIFSRDRTELLHLYRYIGIFLFERLKLKLHPDKCFIKTLASGVEFLGWVHFFGHRVLRTATKKRMLRRIRETDGKEETLASYRGMLSHGNTHKLMPMLGHPMS